MHTRHAHTYARALRRALAGAVDASEAEARAGRMVAAMRRRGHASLLPATVRAYRRVLARERDAGTIRIVAADKAAADAAIANLAAYRSRLGAPADADYTVAYDDSLIGGVRITYGSARIDTSYKRSLLDLYRRITTA